jgi:hypothetical protein
MARNFVPSPTSRRGWNTYAKRSDARVTPLSWTFCPDREVAAMQSDQELQCPGRAPSDNHPVDVTGAHNVGAACPAE